jgi:uncharacterized membrane protein YgaE (UPF0421/DUF939 family)
MVPSNLSAKPGWPRLTGNGLRVALQNAGVCLAAFLAGFYCTRALEGVAMEIGGLWAVISGIVVLQATRRQTWTAAGLRVLGSLIGAAISAAYLTFLPFTPLAMAALIGITVLLCQVIGVPDHARLAGITVAVIMVVSRMHPEINPLINAAMRFIESMIGATLAVLAVLAWPERDRAG